MPSPKLVPLDLTDDERLSLTAWPRRRKTAQALATRSRIILTGAEGGTVQVPSPFAHAAAKDTVTRIAPAIITMAKIPA